FRAALLDARTFVVTAAATFLQVVGDLAAPLLQVMGHAAAPLLQVVGHAAPPLLQVMGLFLQVMRGSLCPRDLVRAAPYLGACTRGGILAPIPGVGTRPIVEAIGRIPPPTCVDTPGIPLLEATHQQARDPQADQATGQAPCRRVIPYAVLQIHPGL